ncbi:MAG: hypothetical protein CME20_02890 [Gemmatimonadetes bacterium]|nr:hypothetical protein [Gemmatimonadota bacterium]
MAQMRFITALLWLLAAAPLAAQEDARPDLSIREPERGARARTYVLASLIYKDAEDGIDRFPLAVPELIQYVEDNTELDVRLRGEDRTLRQLDGITLLYMSGNNAQLRIGAEDRRRLGRFLQDGGLLYAEDVRPRGLGRFRFGDAGRSGTPFDRQFKELVKDPDILGAGGSRWRKVPRDHALYSSFFALPDGPPPGAHQPGTITDLEMLEYRGRVAVLFSDLNLTYFWGDPQAHSRAPSLRFGVNLLVFAIARQQAGPALR